MNFFPFLQVFLIDLQMQLKQIKIYFIIKVKPIDTITRSFIEISLLIIVYSLILLIVLHNKRDNFRKISLRLLLVFSFSYNNILLYRIN